MGHMSTLSECKASGQHLISCDNDGYCNTCGEQPDHDVEFTTSNEYYSTTIAVVLVPVKVRYHAATDIMYGFDAPCRDEVEKCMKEGLSVEDLQRVKAGLNDLHRKLKDTIHASNLDVLAPTSLVVQTYNELHAMGRLLGMWRD